MAATSPSSGLTKQDRINIRKRNIKLIKNNYALYLMLALPVAYFITFQYTPMTNIVIALKDYNIFRGVWESPWANPIWKYFQIIFSSNEFLRALRNTIVLNALDLVIGFPFPVLLAIGLNEIAFKNYKKFTQTVLYLPNFLAWTIVAGMAKQIFAPNSGIVNILMSNMGFARVDFLTNPSLWVATYIATGVWHGAGWGTIIYLAAITGINLELYEAAEVDGANRLRKIWHITLPGIRPTIVTLLILNLGRILSVGFDRPFNMGNLLVREVGEVISTYVYRVGLQSQQFSLATAVGLFQSVVCVIFLILANTIAERLGESGVW